MPLALILYLGVYTPIVVMSSVADATGMDPNCWQSSDGHDYFDREVKDRVHFDVPGWRWLIPYPFRRGKVRIDLREGDKDICTQLTYNGKWWYR